MNNLDSFEVLNSDELLEINGGRKTHPYGKPLAKQPTMKVTINYPPMITHPGLGSRPIKPTASFQK